MVELNEIRNKKVAVVAFGRMNPPTSGHEKLILKVLSVARSENATPFIFVSHTQDVKKNPLTSKQKVKYLRLGVPAASKHIVYDPNVKTIFNAIYSLSQQGYKDIILVAGDDRVTEFKKTLTPYLKHPDEKKSLDVDSLKVVSAGKRDPDADGVEGMSASKMREAAAANNFKLFKTGVASGLSEKFAKEMFDALRKAMNIHEMVEQVQRLQGTLNIPRNKMPQIRADDINDFIKSLKTQGVDISKRNVSVKNLKPTQNEINMEKVKTKYEKIKDGGEIKPFIVSYDNFILDGHHQLFALKSLDKDTTVACYVVGVKMKDLLQLAHEFPKTTYKQITD